MCHGFDLTRVVTGTPLIGLILIRMVTPPTLVRLQVQVNISVALHLHFLVESFAAYITFELHVLKPPEWFIFLISNTTNGKVFNS